MSISAPWKVGVLISTRLAGRLTPDERVEVATSTFSVPPLKAPSKMSRSSNVRPGNQQQKLENLMVKLNFY